VTIFRNDCSLLIRFEGERQSIDHYGRHPGQEKLEKYEFKSISVNPYATHQKPSTNTTKDDEDLDLFGDEDEEESEKTKQLLAAYAEKKAKSNKSENRTELNSLSVFPEPAIVAKSTIVLDVRIFFSNTV